MTSVGGTSLTALGPPPTETVWNESHGAGGGGVSVHWGRPSYQAALAGAAARLVPDVSASADPNHGDTVFWNGGWIEVGGTSAGAPLWAALTALIDQSGGIVGEINPTLYPCGATARPTTSRSGTTIWKNAHGGTYAAGDRIRRGHGLGHAQGGRRGERAPSRRGLSDGDQPWPRARARRTAG